MAFPLCSDMDRERIYHCVFTWRGGWWTPWRSQQELKHLLAKPPAVMEELFPSPGHCVSQGGLGTQPWPRELQGCLKGLEQSSPRKVFWAGGVLLGWSQAYSLIRYIKGSFSTKASRPAARTERETFPPGDREWPKTAFTKTTASA